MRSILLFLMLAASSIMMAYASSNDDLPSFDEYMAKKKRVMAGPERTRRALAYAKNVQRIVELRKRSAKHVSAARYGVNDFALLTLDEFHQKHTGLKRPEHGSVVGGRRMARATRTKTTRTTTTRTTTTRTTTTRTTTTRTTTTRTTTTRKTTTRTTTTRTTTTRTTTTTTPSKLGLFDLTTSGYMTPIKNQAACGSCWAFATITVVEFFYAKNGNPLTRFSEQQILDCDKDNGACDGGWPETALDYVIANGIESESDYPYFSANGANQTCQYNPSLVVARISSHAGTQSESEMLSILQSYGPIVICLNADDIMNYYGGVVLYDNCAGGTVNHAVVLVGYGSENGLDYWKLRNSWDTWWGEDGYFRLQRNGNACGMVLYEGVYIKS